MPKRRYKDEHMESMTVRVSPSLRRRLDRQAEKEEHTVGYVVREILEECLPERERRFAADHPAEPQEQP